MRSFEGTPFASGDLIRLFATPGLEVESVYTDALIPEVERWQAVTATHPDCASDV